MPFKLATLVLKRKPNSIDTITTMYPLHAHYINTKLNPKKSFITTFIMTNLTLLWHVGKNHRRVTKMRTCGEAKLSIRFLLFIYLVIFIVNRNFRVWPVNLSLLMK